MDPIFEAISGQPVPRLSVAADGSPRVIDGQRFLSLEQAAQKFSLSPAALRELWNATWAEYLGDADAPLLESAEPVTASAPIAVPSAASRVREQILRRAIYPRLSDELFEYFMEACRQRRLNPWSNQIIARQQPDPSTGAPSIAIITKIDGFRAIAHRTGQYLQGVGPLWCGADEQWKEIWSSDQPPHAAKFTVFRHDHPQTHWSRVATWRSYAPMIKAEDGTWILDEFWQRMGDVMLGKCAEALALRAAFEDDLSGFYTPEEMAQAQLARPRTVDQRAAMRQPGGVMPEMKQVAAIPVANQPGRIVYVPDDPRIAPYSMD